MILSHSHWDHTEGGKIFADTAKFIAQEGFLRNMDGRYPALPGDITDRNNDGYLDLIEFDQPGFDARPGTAAATARVTSKTRTATAAPRLPSSSPTLPGPTSSIPSA